MATNNPIIVFGRGLITESDDEKPSRLTSPPKFKIYSAPPHKDCLEPLNSKRKQGQHILYKWHGYEWCQEIITKWNDNPATVMGSDSAIVNFTVTLQWKDNNSTSKHVLSIDSYNHDTSEDTPNHKWIMHHKI